MTQLEYEEISVTNTKVDSGPVVLKKKKEKRQQ